MEILDLYNFYRCNTGETMIRGDEVPKDRYILIVHCAIFNSEGQMLIQKRQNSKKKWPNLWDISVGGVADKGETSQVAIARELSEELGIAHDFEEARPALTIHFEKGFDDVFILKKDEDLSHLHLQKEEVKEVRWATIEEIVKMIEQKMFVPYNAHFIRLLYHLKDHSSMISTK